MKSWGGICISVILIALFVLTTDIERTVSTITSANYVFLLPAIGLYLVSIGFRTLRWQWLLKHIRRIRLSRLYPVVVIGYMANNLLPMRLGEVARSYYVGEREGISKSSALVTILVERLLDALTLLLFIASSAFFVPVTGLVKALSNHYGVPWPLLTIGMSLPFIGLFCLLLLLAFSSSKAKSIAVSLIRFLPNRFEISLHTMVDTSLNGLIPLRSPSLLFVLFLISIPIWIFESALFFAVGFAFHLDLAYDSLGHMAIALVVVTAVANIGASVPAAPGGIGLFELIARETLILLPLATIDRSVATGYVAIVHVALILPMILLGQFFLWTEHLSLRKFSKESQPLPQQAGQKIKCARVSNGNEISE